MLLVMKFSAVIETGYPPENNYIIMIVI